MFIDRKQEMSTLEKEYQRNGSSFVVIYGRRRVGKTTLISNFIHQKNALFFLASEESETQNRNMFQERVAEFTGNDLLRNVKVNNWDILFKAIVDTNYKEKPIIVLDEFQYLGKANPAFPSIFQRIWEEILKNQSVMVILCGSLISMMKSQTLAYDSPLYGRRTAQMRLTQIPFRYYHYFFPNKANRELINLYSVTGGVPKYIEVFHQDDDFYTSIEKNIINTSSFLYDEPQFLLSQEVNEVGSYFSIIRAIAMGNTRLSMIASVLEIKATSLSIYLKTLIDLDILEREVPVTEENPEKSKKGLYKIKDNYIRFWFLFVYPFRNFIETGHYEFVLKKIQENLVKNHTAYVYENICKEYMWDLNMKEAWPFHFMRIGRYWDNNTEIDIVALDDVDNNIIFGECKFWESPVGINVLNDLEAKSKQVSWRQAKRQNWYIIFSVSGFSDELLKEAAYRNDVQLITY